MKATAPNAATRAVEGSGTGADAGVIVNTPSAVNVSGILKWAWIVRWDELDWKEVEAMLSTVYICPILEPVPSSASSPRELESGVWLMNAPVEGLYEAPDWNELGAVEIDTSWGPKIVSVKAVTVSDVTRK
jgi:hypothetical protein